MARVSGAPTRSQARSRPRDSRLLDRARRRFPFVIASRMPFQIRLVPSSFVAGRWLEISEHLRAAFSGPAFSDAFGAERPVIESEEQVHGERGEKLVHLIAESPEGEVLGGFLGIPVLRTGDETSCPLGWFFTREPVSEPDGERIGDALVERAHQEAAKLGYGAVVTSLGSMAASDFMSRRHGYLPAPTREQSDRWTSSLAREGEDDSIRSSAKMEWQRSTDQFARYATADIGEGEILIDLKRVMKRVEQRSANTLELGEGFYYKASPEPLGLNHHCSPNGYICFEDLTYRALRDISKGEELSFHYCTTEYEMANPFDCLCGSPVCLGWIGGFSHLDEAQVERLSEFISPFLLSRR